MTHRLHQMTMMVLCIVQNEKREKKKVIFILASCRKIRICIELIFILAGEDFSSQVFVDRRGVRGRWAGF
jgi:hypothetical protein